MKPGFFLVVVGLLCLAAEARALSPVIEIFPGQPNHGFEAVDVSSERLADGDRQFTVVISPKGGDRNYGTSLGTVAITEHSESSHGLRALAAEKNGNVIQCVFPVTAKELENPDLAFRLTYGAGNGGWAFTTYFIRLKNFVKP